MLKKLINWQKENGYTNRFVANKLGITESQYSKIRLGQQKPTVGMAEKLVEVFHVQDVFDLLKNTRE